MRFFIELALSIHSVAFVEYLTTVVERCVERIRAEWSGKSI